MWNQPESQVVRLIRQYESEHYSPEALFHKFSSASREDVRLACALIGFFLFDDNHAPYQTYLKRRINSAVPALIELNRPRELAFLEKVHPFSREETNRYLKLSIQMNRPEMITWFLLYKDGHYGFQDRSFVL